MTRKSRKWIHANLHIFFIGFKLSTFIFLGINAVEIMNQSAGGLSFSVDEFPGFPHAQ